MPNKNRVSYSLPRARQEFQSMVSKTCKEVMDPVVLRSRSRVPKRLYQSHILGIIYLLLYPGKPS